MVSNRWVLQAADQEGHVNLLRGGRQLRADVTLAEAKRYLKCHRQPGDTVHTEDLDGYRTRLSSPSSRRRKR